MNFVTENIVLASLMNAYNSSGLIKFEEKNSMEIKAGRYV